MEAKISIWLRISLRRFLLLGVLLLGLAFVGFIYAEGHLGAFAGFQIATIGQLLYWLAGMVVGARWLWLRQFRQGRRWLLAAVLGFVCCYFLLFVGEWSIFGD